MRVVTCDETGLVKAVWVEKEEVVATWRQQDRALAPKRICLAPNDDNTVRSCVCVCVCVCVFVCVCVSVAPTLFLTFLFIVSTLPFLLCEVVHVHREWGG